jgi:hypothetical protein
MRGQVKDKAEAKDKAKWISFYFLLDTGKTKIWEVMSKGQGAILGVIKWYGAWRKYSFSPRSNTIFEEKCLRDIADFCERETLAHRAARKRAKEAA